MLVDILSVFAIICVAIIVGKLVARIQLPAILGWLITGIIFGPYLVGIITTEITDATWYQIVIKFFECFAGVMIGKEIIFKKIAKSGKQIIGLLPHSGVSLIFTGIAVNTMTTIDASLAAIISGTIVSAAIINEIIAVLLAKTAFKWAGEISQQSSKK